MSLNPEIIQLFIILSISFPFLIPLFKKYGKMIPLLHIGLGMIMLIFYWASRDYNDITIIFGGHNALNGIEILFDFNSSIFLLSTYIVFFCVLFYTFSERNDWKYYFLINLLMADLTCLFMANDLFNIYVTLELLSLICYLLISYKNKRLQIWASLKYMILGAISFNIYILGVAMIYNSTGSLNLSSLSNMAVNTLPVLLIFFTLLVKSGFFFFSMWLPLAQSESESQVSAILSSAVDKAGLFLILRLKNVFHLQELDIFLTSAAVITIIFGTFFSIKQKNIKMILGFSTMSQMGILLLGSGTAVILYAFSHSIIKTILFLTSGYIYSKYGTNNLFKRTFKLPKSFFLSSWVAYLSISGLPFFLGSIYKHNIKNGQPELLKYLLVIATIGSIVAIGRILFRLRISKSETVSPTKMIAIILPLIISLTVGIISTLNDIKGYYFIETTLLFAIGLLILYLTKSKIRYCYNYKVFNLSNAISYYYFILFFMFLICIFF